MRPRTNLPRVLEQSMKIYRLQHVPTVLLFLFASFCNAQSLREKTPQVGILVGAAANVNYLSEAAYIQHARTRRCDEVGGSETQRNNLQL